MASTLVIIRHVKHTGSPHIRISGCIHVNFKGYVPRPGAAIDPANGLGCTQVIGHREDFKLARSQLCHHQIPRLDHLPRLSRSASDNSWINP
jgi:hypothetical protein